MKKRIKFLTLICVLLTAVSTSYAQTLPSLTDLKSDHPGTGNVPSISVYGDTVTFTFTIQSSQSANIPTGTVQFEDNGIDIDSPVTLTPVPFSVDSAYAILKIAILDASTVAHVIVANYSGSNSFTPSTDTLRHTVVRADTYTEITDVKLAENQATLRVEAEVTVDPPGGGIPTGMVGFYLDGNTTAFGSRALNSSGIAILDTTMTFTSGTRTITARYLGSPNYYPSAMSPDTTFFVSDIPRFTNPSAIYKVYGDTSFLLPPVTGGLGNGAYRYRSTMSSVATVNDSTGRVTVVGVGETNIYVKRLSDGAAPESPESAPLRVIVSRKTLTVTGITASREYDGTNVFTNAQIDITNAVINGIVGTDDVRLSKAGVTGTFGPNIGTGTLTLTGNFTLIGTGIANYALTQPTVAATIVGRSNNSINNIVIDGTNIARNGNDFTYTMPCGSDILTVNVSTDQYASVTINGVQQNPRSFALTEYGDNVIPVVVTAQNGTPASYTLTVYRSVPLDIAFYDRFANVLTVPLHIDGLAPVNSVEWYRNGARLDRAPSKGYLEIKEAGTYYALLNGEYRTCEFIQATAPSTLSMSVYPNPAEAGREITVNIENLSQDALTGAQLQLHGIDGRILKTMPVPATGNPNNVTFAAPGYSGMVVIRLITTTENQEVKLIIK